MYKKRYRQKTFQNCRLFKPLTSVTDLYAYMRSSEVQNMGMTNYPIIYLDLAAYVIGKIGNNSSLCIHNELLGLMGSLSSLK